MELLKLQGMLSLIRTYSENGQANENKDFESGMLFLVFKENMCTEMRWADQVGDEYNITQRPDVNGSVDYCDAVPLQFSR